MPETTIAEAPSRLDQELAGLDALDLPTAPRESLGRRAWRAAGPKGAAPAPPLFLWQCVVWSGWKPEFLLPGPKAVFQELFDKLGDPAYRSAIGRTMQRAAIGY